jgi:hypothetical protein
MDIIHSDDNRNDITNENIILTMVHGGVILTETNLK